MFKKIAMLCVGIMLLAGVVSSTPDQGQNQDATVSPANWLGSELRVMTRNIYVGADLDMLLAQGLDVIDLVLGQLFMTSFPDRARGFAEEILEAKPHVIGLQEVSTISVGAFEMDYLTILLMTLEAYGLHYTVANQVENFNITVPIGDPDEGYYTQLIDKDVILSREGVEISNPAQGLYTQGLPVDALGGAIIHRGWVAVTAKVGRKTYRVVSTHLESIPEGHPGVEYIQFAQAQELMGILQAESLPTIVMGDLNTEAPAGMSYQAFVNSGFVDIWKRNLLRRFNRNGFTYGHDAVLRNETVEFSKRIDYVMVRSNIGIGGWQFIGPVFAWVVGDELDDRVWVEDYQEWIWPSDHGGVIARLYIPKF